MESAYIQAYADYGYTSPKRGDRRHNKLHCRACHVIFFDGDAEGSSTSRLQFVIAKGMAVVHHQRSNHIIEFDYTQRAQ